MSKYIAYITPYKNTVIIDYTELFGDDSISGDSVTMSIDIPNSNTSEFDNYINGRLFINSVRYDSRNESQNEIECLSKPYIFSVRINPDNKLFCDGKVNLTFNNSSDNIIELYVSSSDVQKIGDYVLDAHTINGRMNTFMLMRTDPKLTGNIKLVVDSNSRLYLDTFKVSSILNNRIYRKYPVSSDGNYPRDVMTVFSNLPKSELFKTPADSLNPHKYYSSFKKQYITDYEYGAETNTDNMYSENMKILAPVHIGKNVPDFFCIFRYDGVYNENTYHSAVIDDTVMFDNLLKTAKVVKIFDLRSYTSVGKYIHNYCTMLNQYLHGSCYLQFIEQDNDKNSSNYRQGNNSWRGIDIDHGLITNKIESSYFANNILESNDSVQEKYNDYIINGYERNNLLYPYILNMEFMFNDTDSDEFKMNRYFGLYMTANEFLKYQCIITDVQSDNGRTLKLDSNDKEIHDDALIHQTVSVSDFSNRVFFMTTNNDASRVQSEDDVRMFIDKFVLDNPDINIANISSVPVTWKDDERSFITITFNEPIYYGEHIRFICPNHITEDNNEPVNICLEIIASNDERLLSEDSYISPYVLTNSPDEIYKNDDITIRTSFYRISFYSQSITDSSVSATIEEQIKRIRSAIDKFNSFIKVSSFDDTTLCVTSTCETTYLQHILPVNKYKSPDFCQLYVTSNGNKFDLHYTKSNKNSSYDSYITKIKKILSSKLTSNDCLDNSAEAYDGKFYTDTKDSAGNPIQHAVNYIEYEDPDNIITDTMRYFSRTYETNMYLLSPDTETYSSMYLALSMFGFENLGWRYSSIIPFKKMADFSYPYAVYDDMDEILKYTKHPLVKSVNGRFETIKKQSIAVDYLTDNAILMLENENINIPTQRLITLSSLRNTIISPYNCKSVIIDFQTEPFSHNSELALFNPESASLCVMGIMSIKDIDLRINLNEDIVITNKKSVTIPSGDIVSVGSLSDNRIVKDCVYRITSGSFIEFPMKEFIMSGKDIRYTSDGKNVIQAAFNSGILTASGDVTIELVNQNEDSILNNEIISNIPSQNDENLFKNKNDIANSYLNVSIVPQTNCLWMSNGLYFDNNSILSTDELTSGNYEPNGYFTELSQSPSLDADGNMFVKNSVNSYMYNLTSGTVRFRDVIKTASVKNIIKKMIIQNGMPDTAVGYYNSYVQTLEFVYYGIKFGLKFNSDYYNQNVHIGEYNNFDVYFINEPDFSDENELFISVDEEIIVFVNHRFDMKSDNKERYYSQLTRVNTNEGIICENDYSAYRAPYNIEPDSICGFESAFIASKTNDNKILFENNIKESYFIQEDHAPYNMSDNENILPNYTFFKIYDENNDWTTDNDIFNINEPVVGILRRTAQGKYITDKFSNVNNLDIDAKDLTVYGNRVSESYIIDVYSNDSSSEKNENTTETGSERLKKYINSITGNVRCYIVKNNNVNEMYITDNYKPLSITMQRPSKIKYNFGYFIPKFYDILTFNTNDYDLSVATGMNMLLGNTNVKKVNRINTYTTNKIFSGTNEISVYKNYYITHNRSVMSSNWDMGYYRRYTDNENYTLLNGYIPGIEDKSFFGSRCLVLKNEYIELDDFSAPRINPQVEQTNSVHNVYSENRIQCKITINITQSIYSKFENEQMFVNNWNNNDFSKEQMSTAIGNYIQNSISEIYNIQRRREIVIYRKKNSNSSDMKVEFSANPDGYDDWEIISDYDARMITESNEMILTITLSIEQGSIIHPFVKIYRF